MTHTKANKSKVLAFILGLTMCLALMLGIAMASPTNTVYAAGGTPVTELTVSGLTDADVPQIGKKATLPTLTVNEGLKLNTATGVYWSCSNKLEPLKDTDTFESGYTYALRIQYSVLSGYEWQITDPAKIKLDGVTTPYTVEIDKNAFIEFIFDALGDEELSLVNPERMQIKDGYVGASAGTNYIYVKGGKFPYRMNISNIQCPSWLKYDYHHDNGKFWRINFYGIRPTTPTSSENFSFTITDDDGTSKTFTGTTGETKENPGAIQNIVVKYNLPDVEAHSPTNEQLKPAITLPPNVVCKGAMIYKTEEYSSTTSFTFEKWGKYTLRLYLETTNGKRFAGSSLLEGYLVSSNNFSYSASFGNYTETSLTLDFAITKYGVTIEELDTYKMTTEILKPAKKGVNYNEKIEFTKPAGVDDSDIKIVCSKSTPLFGLSVNAEGIITGTPDDQAYYNSGETTTIKVTYLCKGYELDSKEYSLVIEGYTQIYPPYGKTLKYNGNEQIGVDENAGYTLTGTYKATDVGEYTAIAKLNPGYRWGTPGSGQYEKYDKEITWEIEIGEQSAPPASLFTTVAPTTSTTTDGKITGITAEMEYRKVGDSTWTSGTGSDVTGLSSGKYQIRFKETVNYNAGEVTEVEVPESGVSSYNLTVTGGTGGGVFIQGASVTITANAPATGKKFSGWTIDGISGLDTTQTSITFNMPANAVTATANYEDIEYTITVNGGTADKEKAKYGETVTITATVPTGKRFVEWTSESGSIFADKTNVTTTFTMPAGDVTVEATFADEIYRITVTDGTSSASTATYQTEVTVKANEPDTDMYFDKWEVTGLDTTDMDLTKTEIKFQMPAGNVTFKATYLAVTKYEIVIVDGTKDKEVAKAGETVTITANPAPTGKVFDKWTCETAGVTIEFASATSSPTTFVMPASNIKIQAHFRAVESKPSVEIKVNDGTGAGTYTQGDEVTVTAEEKDGKVFTGWQDESGKIVSTNKSYTFTVTEATTLTAVYEDKSSGGGEITPPAKKDGLSGGQIAGIVIGSVAVAGIGGFAIFWFAVKKKTFADLGVALKKGFTAIGNFFKTLGAKIKALFTKKK